MPHSAATLLHQPRPRRVQISDEDAEKITTVGEAVDFIYEHTS